MTSEEKAAYNLAYRTRNREKINAQAREYHRLNRDERFRKSREYKLKHREEVAAYMKAWRLANPEKVRGYAAARALRTNQREAALKRKYGLTIPAFDALLAQQMNVCAVCKADDWGTHGPVVDHNHSSGAVRGILCHRCNSAIGMVREDAAIAASIINYLKGGAE